MGPLFDERQATDAELRAALILGESVDKEAVAVLMAKLRGGSVIEARARLESSQKELREYFERPVPKPLHKRSPTAERVQSVVYFVEAVGLHMIKIGWTLRIATRLRTLQCASPNELRLVATTPGGHKDEKTLHNIFRLHRVRGEWFTYATEVDQLIDNLKARVA